MRLPLLVLGILLCGGPLAAQTPAPRDHPDVAAILAIRDRLEQADRLMSVDGLDTILADDVVMQPGRPGEVVGAQRVIDLHEDIFARFEEYDMTFLPAAVSVMGNLATETGSYTATLVPMGGGDPQEVAGEYLYQYRRSDDGRWKIQAMSWGGGRTDWRASEPRAEVGGSASEVERAIEGRVAAALAAYSFEGQPPSVDSIIQHFTPDARLMWIREDSLVTRPAAAFFEGWRRNMVDSGTQLLQEWETRGETTWFGNLAHRSSGFALYLNDTAEVAQRGFMSFRLVRLGERWLIQSMAWQVAGPDDPLPARFMGETAGVPDR